jgi:BirA family biotin operon repressor/biotin-[acetyl-CoA-carboxylase] ligase
VAPPDHVAYDGRDEAALAALLDLPRVEAYRSIGSALDVAHERGAAGAAGGTLVLAEEQTAGRGRGGRAWRSAPGAGIWLALLERPVDASAADVLALRLGLAAARALDRWTTSPVRLKWPNDLYVGDGKLGGILVESRWRGAALDWVAIGIGINVHTPEGVERRAATLERVTDRGAVLAELVPALRAAAAARGGLAERELAAWAARDIARGRRCREPVAGTVQGIDGAGALVVRTDRGEERLRAGSLVLEEET